jgi:hypothetical protein
MIKFIEYTGKYPNLCSGTLTLDIDGEVVTFGYECGKVNYPQFWHSGGSCGFLGRDYDETYCNNGEWELDKTVLPDKYKNIGKELIQVFNSNVRWGCCGGCI